MDTSLVLSRQGHRLLQIAVALFLFMSFEGFAILGLRGRTVERAA